MAAAADQAAAAKMAQSSSSKLDKKLTPRVKEAVSLMSAGMAELILSQANRRLRSRGSIWAMDEDELRDNTAAIEAVLDKWLPDDISKWSPEVVLIVSLLLYVVPRVMEQRELNEARDREAAAQSAAQGARPTAAPAPERPAVERPLGQYPEGAEDPRLTGAAHA
jgi:hypothetical protein